MTRRSLVTVLASGAAELLTIAAILLDNVTFVNSVDARRAVVSAAAAAFVAIVLILMTWRRTPPIHRAIHALCVLANLWTLIDALGRRLPALGGW